MRLASDVDAATAAQADVDLLLMPHWLSSHFEAHGWRINGRRAGGGLSAALWNGHNVTHCPSATLSYGDTPGDITPGQILGRIQALP